MKRLLKRADVLDGLARVAARKGIDLAGLTAQLEALPDKGAEPAPDL